MDPGGKIQNSGPPSHRMGPGPRPRFAPTRVQSSPRQASPHFQTSPRQSFHTPNQSGVRPVSLTQASPQGAGRGSLGQRHQPYPANRKKQSQGAMKLPTDSTKARKNLTPGKVIKIEPLPGGDTHEASVDNGDSVSKEDSLSGNTDSSENKTADAMLSESSPSVQDTMSAVVKSESSESSSEPTDGTFSEIQLPQGLGLESDANTSVQEPVTSGEHDSLISDVNESISVKVEAGDDDMDLEITGVEPGQMAPSDTDWMSNVEFDPSVSGASNQNVTFEGQSGQEYGEWNIFTFIFSQSQVTIEARNIFMQQLLNTQMKLPDEIKNKC